MEKYGETHLLLLCLAGAQVREVDLKAVTGGIVHTKLWVIDQKHFYVGSANMDWRSLSQVQQLLMDKKERKKILCKLTPLVFLLPEFHQV